jgi:hypothetical protein
VESRKEVDVRTLLIGAALLLTLIAAGCNGCPAVTLKTLDLPGRPSTGRSGPAGARGVCLSKPNLTPSAFAAGPSQILVGFDDYYKAGTNPFPCDEFRSQIFRGGLLFDLSPFDAIVSASLLFDTASSVSRQNGESLGSIPGKSYATTLGMATQAFSAPMFADNDAPLGPGPTFDIGVTSQVKDWVAKARPNFGFVVGGPRSAAIYEDNDAQVSFYQNFRLRVVYNPAQNPRAPQ